MTAAHTTTAWDADLAGLADVRSKARAAREAFDRLAGSDQETLDRFVRAMALAGTPAARILKHYYPTLNLTRAY